MASSTRKAGLVLALLLVALALPGWSEDKPQQTSGSTPAETASQAASPSGEEAQKATPAPAPVAASGTAAPIETPPESATPPRNLHKVGDHWTPYDPPDMESYPEGAQVHRIESGDNLWNLANTHFQNPYLWPQIWNENRYIQDSHWIYPGDPLLLPPRPTVVSEIIPAGGQTAPPLPPAPETSGRDEEAGGPAVELPATEDTETGALLPDAGAVEMGTQESFVPPAADHTDIYCTGEIRRSHKKTDLYIANEEQEDKIGLTEGDIIYLNGGSQGGRVKPGDEFQIIAKDDEVYHPMTDKWLGTYYRREGRVKVLVVQENTAIAQITESCGRRIEVGFELEPFEEIPVPELTEVPFDKLDVEPSGKANGYVVHLQDGKTLAQTGNVVDVDLGTRDGLKAGDILLLYVVNKVPRQRTVKYSYKWDHRRYESQKLRSEDDDLLYPRKPIGHLMVLGAGERTSRAKVVHTIREVEVGTAVEVR